MNDDNYLEMVGDLLTNVHQDLYRDRQRPLTLFVPRQGSKYDGRMMLIGRAVNGWKHDFILDDVADEEGRTRFLDGVHRKEDQADCPMKWVADLWPRPKGKYSTSRSAYWRAARKVAAHLGIRGSDWPSHLAWSNLYKVSPAGTGNPDSELRRAQLDACRRLLRWEVEHFQPKVIVALTGWWWFRDFAEALGADVEVIRDEPVEAVGRVGESLLVVAPHPQGKREGHIVERVREVVEQGVV